MTNAPADTMEGGCTCGAVRYRLNARPMFVHCCHCTWCQRETGSAFALNALMTEDRGGRKLVTEVHTPKPPEKKKVVEDAPVALLPKPIRLFDDYVKAIYNKDRIRASQAAARPGESAEQAKARSAAEFAALQNSPFFDLWASAGADEILSALHEKLTVGGA